jgi:hypothetical protein
LDQVPKFLFSRKKCIAGIGQSHSQMTEVKKVYSGKLLDRGNSSIYYHYRILVEFPDWLMKKNSLYFILFNEEKAYTEQDFLVKTFITINR